MSHIFFKVAGALVATAALTLSYSQPSIAQAARPRQWRHAAPARKAGEGPGLSRRW